MVLRLTEPRPDLVFNLMEMFGRNWQGDVGIAGLLQLLGYRFTGGGPGMRLADSARMNVAYAEPRK